VQAILHRHDLGRLDRGDRATNTEAPRRYQRERPGELAHVDVKKLAGIPDGGGWRVHALDPASSAVEVLAQAAVWAHTAEEAERKAEYSWLAQQALDPTDPRSATFLVFMEPGEDPRFPDPQAAVEALLPAIDLDREWWLARQPADTAPNDAPEVPTAIQRLVDLAARVRAPRLMIAAEVSQGAVAAFRARDFDVTLTHFSRALDIAVASNDAVAEAECRRMVALAIVGLGRDDALDACRDALVHVYGVRHWLRIWQLFGSLGLAWAERDVLEPASVVETSDPGASPAGSGRAHRSLRGLSAQRPHRHLVGQSAAAPGRRPCPSAVGLEDREPAVASRGPHDKQEAHPAPVA
jgi:hypothetical protein